MKIFILTFLALTLLSPVTAFAQNAGNTVYVDVNGLVCDFCARAVEKVFNEEESVEGVKVDLNTKVITISFVADKELSEEKIRELITDSGYDVVAVRSAEDG